MPTGGGRFHPPSGILEFLQLLVISMPRNFLTFPKYILTWFRKQKNGNFLGGTTFRPFENIEISFSKIDLKIFAIDNIFLLQNCFILIKWGWLQKTEFKRLWFDWVMSFFVKAQFFLGFPTFYSNGHKIHNFFLVKNKRKNQKTKQLALHNELLFE